MIRKQLLSQFLGGKLTCDEAAAGTKEYLEIYLSLFKSWDSVPGPYFYRNDPQWRVTPEMEEVLASEQQEGFQILDTANYKNMIVAFTENNQRPYRIESPDEARPIIAA